MGSDQLISGRSRYLSQAGCKVDEGGYVSIGTREKASKKGWKEGGTVVITSFKR